MRHDYKPIPKEYTYEKIRALCGPESVNFIKNMDEFNDYYINFHKEAQIKNNEI